jgi:hypothetical protein
MFFFELFQQVRASKLSVKPLNNVSLYWLKDDFAIHHVCMELVAVLQPQKVPDRFGENYLTL